MLNRKSVGIGVGVVVLFVLGVSQIYAQSGLTLEGLSSRITTLNRRVSTLSNTKVSNHELAALESRVATLEAKFGITSVATATRRRPTLTPTPRPPTSTPTRRPTSTPTRVRPTVTSTPAQPYIRIASRNMNVRSGPGVNYTVVGYATTGQEFDITGKNADGTWWRIDFEGENAWIYAPYVTAFYADRIRSVPTPIPPTATPLPPTATPAPASSTTQEMSEEEAIQLVMLSDYQYNESEFNNLTQSQKEQLVTGYILFLEYVADYCGLSHGNTAQLLDYYASDLDRVRFTSQDGTKPRAFLMAFVYGFTRDTSPGSHSCRSVLALGQAAALSN